jgi:hypothetical protein
MRVARVTSRFDRHFQLVVETLQCRSKPKKARYLDLHDAPGSDERYRSQSRQFEAWRGATADDAAGFVERRWPLAIGEASLAELHPQFSLARRWLSTSMTATPSVMAISATLNTGQ